MPFCFPGNAAVGSHQLKNNRRVPLGADWMSHNSLTTHRPPLCDPDTSKIRARGQTRMTRCSASLLVCAILPGTVGSFGLLLPPCPRLTHQDGASRQSSRHRMPSVGRHSSVPPGTSRPERARRWSPLAASPGPDEEQRPPSPDAESTAEAVLRRLSPSELEGMKARLSLDGGLEGEGIIAEAVPILAAKIRARETAQEVGRSAAVAAEYRPDDVQAPAPAPAVARAPPVAPSREQSEGDWAGGNGVVKGWVGEKGSRRLVTMCVQ